MAVGYELRDWIDSSGTGGFRVSSYEKTYLYLNFI
jgi:hypothetical protein